MLKVVKAFFVEWDEDDTVAKIDKACRINMRFMTLKNIPRDILVHFFRKKTRGEAVQ